MSVTRNSLANFAGTLYASAVAVAVVPMYLLFMEPEAFGLVGFFALAQGWLALLDLGLSQAISRSAAVSGAGSRMRFVRLFKSVETLFLLIALLVALLFSAASPYLAESWLNISTIDPDGAETSLRLIGVAIALRIFMGLYKSGLQGFELHVRLNALNIVGATMRYPIALACLSTLDWTYLDFFRYQVIVAALELAGAMFLLYRILPLGRRGNVLFDCPTFMAAMPFSLHSAYGALVTAVIVQIDRLVLSRVLTLEAFGYLAVVTLLSTGLIQLGGPIVQAVLPRLTSLHASRRQQDAERLYLAGAEVLAVLLTPVALTIAVFAHPILLLWTGEEAAANWGEVPLLWYASGSLLMAYASGPYMLQYMRGDLRLHTRFLTCMALVQTPTMIALSIYTHVVFVAAAWCLFRLMTVVAWGAYVHHRIMPGAYAPWLTALARSVGLCLAILVPAKIVLTPSLQSFATSMQVLILGLFWLCAASLTALASPTGRRWLVTVFR